MKFNQYLFDKRLKEKFYYVRIGRSYIKKLLFSLIFILIFFKQRFAIILFIYYFRLRKKYLINKKIFFIIFHIKMTPKSSIKKNSCSKKAVRKPKDFSNLSNEFQYYEIIKNCKKKNTSSRN